MCSAIKGTQKHTKNFWIVESAHPNRKRDFEQRRNDEQNKKKQTKNENGQERLLRQW